MGGLVCCVGVSASICVSMYVYMYVCVHGAMGKSISDTCYF